MDAKEFNIAEIFSNMAGKTDLAAVAGFIVIITGVLAYLYGVFHKDAPAITNQAMPLISVGGGLIVTHRVTDLNVKKADASS